MAPPANGRPSVVIRGARLLDTAHGGEPGDLLIAGDTIAAVGPPGLAAPDEAEVLDGDGFIVMPGLVNAHTHGDVSLAKGLGDRWTLELLLNATPLTSVRFGREDKYLAAKLAAAEMALSGCTACYDLFSEFPTPSREGLEAVGRAYAEVGIRAVVAPLMADRTFWQAVPGLVGELPEPLRSAVERMTAAPSEASLAACRAALRSWPYPRDFVRLALAPTIPHHCEPDFFRACRALADEHGIGIHTHVAESKLQAVVGLRLFGKTLTAHLDGLGIIGPDFTAAHAVWVDADDVRRLADRGASIAHNPTSNLRLGVGAAKVRDMLDAGVRVGVGTDASTCGDHLNMFEAMRLACYVSRLHSPDPARWLTAEEALAAATTGSAGALGFGETIGRIAAGFKADLVFLDARKIQYLPLNHCVRQVVFQENGTAIRHVMAGGKMIVRDGRLTTIDFDRLRTEIERLAERIAAESAPDRDLIARLEPIVCQFCVGLSSQPFAVERYVGA